MTARFSTLNDCINIATLAHSKDSDKSGFPYIEHPLRVMRNVQAQGAMPFVQMAAVLHDVTEDTWITVDMLLAAGVPPAAVEVVKLVDRNYSRIKFDAWQESFGDKKPAGLSADADEYYYRQIRNNPGALQVKLSDIGDNLQPWRLAYLPEEKQIKLRTKYAKALELLK